VCVLCVWTMSIRLNRRLPGQGGWGQLVWNLLDFTSFISYISCSERKLTSAKGETESFFGFLDAAQVCICVISTLSSL